MPPRHLPSLDQTDRSRRRNDFDICARSPDLARLWQVGWMPVSSAPIIGGRGDPRQVHRRLCDRARLHLFAIPAPAQHIAAKLESRGDHDLVHDHAASPVAGARALHVDGGLPRRLCIPAIVPLTRRVELAATFLGAWPVVWLAPCSRDASVESRWLAGRRRVEVDARDRVHRPRRPRGDRALVDEGAFDAEA